VSKDSIRADLDMAIKLDKELKEGYLMKAYFYREDGDKGKSCPNLLQAE
jgi:hypothetical protein